MFLLCSHGNPPPLIPVTDLEANSRRSSSSSRVQSWLVDPGKVVPWYRLNGFDDDKVELTRINMACIYNIPTLHIILLNNKTQNVRVVVVTIVFGDDVLKSLTFFWSWFRNDISFQCF